jgi:hypothetical protein
MVAVTVTVAQLFEVDRTLQFGMYVVFARCCFSVLDVARAFLSHWQAQSATRSSFGQLPSATAAAAAALLLGRPNVACASLAPALYSAACCELCDGLGPQCAPRVSPLLSLALPVAAETS